MCWLPLRIYCGAGVQRKKGPRETHDFDLSNWKKGSALIRDGGRLGEGGPRVEWCVF